MTNTTADSDAAGPSSTRPRSAPPIDNLLNVLDEPGREFLLRGTESIVCGQGEVAVEQGSYVDRLFVVEDGLLRVEVPDRHGLPFEVARYRRGDYFGEMSFLRGDRASATVRAITDARLSTIRHSTLGDLADRYPGIMRELAGIVAGRLNETNLRFRQLRPGRAMGVVSEGGPWGHACLLRVAASASRHMLRPICLVDMTGHLLVAAPTFPSIMEMLADSGLLQVHDRFAMETDGLAVVDGRGGETELQKFLPLLSDLQARYPLVLVHGESGSALDLRMVDALDGPILIHAEGADDRSWVELASRPGAQTVLLRQAPEPCLTAALASLGAETGERVVRVVPGGRSALEADVPLQAVADEPRASIDWVARHLLRRKVGLALGAGGSKGYAHLGVVDRLRQLGVPIDFIAGSSIGSPIAAAVANGMRLGELKRHLDHTFARALRPTLPIHSFLSSRVLAAELTKIAQGKKIEELDTPLAIVAVDLFAREEVVFREGDVARAVVASMAIPGIFPPSRIDGRHLVDGGLLNPVPNATVAAMGADVVIGVKLTNPVSPQRGQPRRFAFRAPPIVDTIQVAFEVMQWKITSETAARADITIEPAFAGTTGLREFSRAGEFIDAGRASVDSARAAIQDLLPWAK